MSLPTLPYNIQPILLPHSSPRISQCCNQCRARPPCSGPPPSISPLPLSPTLVPHSISTKGATSRPVPCSPSLPSPHLIAPPPLPVTHLGAPLHLYKGRDVASSAVLALEGAAVLGGHDVAHLLHHVTEALHLVLVAEALACKVCGEGDGWSVEARSRDRGRFDHQSCTHCFSMHAVQVEEKFALPCPRPPHISHTSPHTCENTRCRLPSSAWPKHDASW